MAGLKIFKILIIPIIFLCFSPIVFSDSTILVQNKKAAVLIADKNKYYEIKYEDSLSQLFALELANKMISEGLKTKINSSYNEELKSIYKNRAQNNRSDYLLDIKFIEHIIYSSNPLSKGIRFFVRILDNKSGEILKEYAEDSGSMNQIQINNGTGLQLLMETKSINTFNDLFLGYEAPMDYLKIKLPSESTNCPNIKRVTMALDADLDSAAKDISTKLLLECKSEIDQEIINGLLSIAELKLGNKNRSIKILEQYLKIHKSDYLSVELNNIKKFGLSIWR